MDRNQFVTILNRYTGSTLQEAEEIASLKSKFPYSQLLHILSARVSKDHGLNDHQSVLQLAAIHSADRTVLKEIINVVAEESLSRPSAASPPIETAKDESQAPAEKAPYYKMDTDDVAGEVMRDLQKLSKLKHNFEMLLVDYSDVNIKSTRKERQANGAHTTEPLDAHPENVKSKRQRIIELAKGLHTPPPEEKITEKAQGRKKKKDFPDTIIEEIRTTKDEIVPESEKQKEQIELINQFIKTAPTISNPRDRSVLPAGDLSTIKSGEFGENIISETLVEILIKQGKKDKAIEVLKKLIWKYPQKKTYFASQIEELKK